MNDTIIQGDCLDVMRGMVDNSVDLIITSPPYNLGGDFHTMVNGSRVSYGGYSSFGDNMPELDYQDWQIEVINECHRIIKPSGNMFYIHKNRLKDFRIISPFEWLFKTKMIIRQEVIWDTTIEMNQDNRRFIPCHEKIFWLSKNTTYLQNDLRLQDCWVFRNKLKRAEIGHPATYPIEIIMNIIELCPDADLVLDPFLGSGTTAVASVNLDRHYIGIDTSEEYCELSRQRVEDARKVKHSQPELFEV